MKFVIDVNLPRPLIVVFRCYGQEADYATVHLPADADDWNRWSLVALGAAIVTKENDLVDFASRRAERVAVVWLRCAKSATPTLCVSRPAFADDRRRNRTWRADHRDPMTFARFVAVDWTGAIGERHAAIAVAECFTGGTAPALVRPGHRWSRGEVFAFVADLATRCERALVGFDFSFSLPFADGGAFFPGDADSPADARALWAEVDAAAAADAHFAAHGAIERRRTHYWLGAADGDKAAKARLRTVERIWAAKRRGPASSVFALLGAAQCGKASLSGMRLLYRWGLPVWPFDAVPATGPLIVEIYCRTFAADAGVRGKIRNRVTLDAALAHLGSAPAAVPATFSDHVGDALISAAGMRRAAEDRAIWAPVGLDAVRATEGWTFGVA